MNKISSKTPRTEFMVQGVLLMVPEPFKTGDVLLENEANSVNQTYRENVRNNNAKEITALKEKEKDPAKLKAAAQAIIEKYCESYEFGVRSGGGRTTDPVMAIAMGIARTYVKEHWKKLGKKTADYTTADLNAAARKVVETNAQIRDYAEKELANKKKALAGVEISV